jgi:glycosyltransferase involved in cell wall biosynthesis/GT2 family glycosyltransferase
MKQMGLIKELELCSTLGDYSHYVEGIDFDVSITMVHPNSFTNATTLANFIQIYKLCKKNYLSVVWETEPLPDTWKFLWDGDLFTGFLSPSYFILNQLKKVTKKPLFYFPHFVNKDNFPQINVEDKLDEKYFKVLFIGQYSARKGMEDAVVAFSRALGDKSDCKLILKYHPLSNKELHPEDFIKYLNRCNVSKHNTNSIYSLESFLNVEELSKLYRESSLLLACSRGEGFGLTSPESMLSGIPVAYTNWSSLLEVSEAEGNYPIDYTLDEAITMSHHGYVNFSFYARPFIRSMMDILVETYTKWSDNKKDYYNSVKHTRDLTINKFGEEKIVEHIIDILGIDKKVLLTPVSIDKEISVVMDKKYLIATSAFSNPELLENCINSLPKDTDNIIFFDGKNGLDVFKDYLISYPNQKYFTCNDHLGVAQSWNQLLKYAFNTNDYDTIVIIGADIEMQKGYFSGYVKDLEVGDFDFTTAKDYGFNCFAITKKCYDIVGGFDENIFPAYFEDNDYHTRVKLSGLTIGDIGNPDLFKHYGSVTIKNDEFYNSANGQTFKMNEKYYCEKWGSIPGDADRFTYKTPFNNPDLSIKDWELDIVAHNIKKEIWEKK